MAVQLDYGMRPAVAVPGMIAEMFSLRQIDSYLVGGVDIIPFGYPVVFDPITETVLIGDSPNSHFVGITVFTQHFNGCAAGGEGGYMPKDQVPVMKRGRIWVRAGGPIAYGSAVYGSILGDGYYYEDSALDTRINVGGVFMTSADAIDDLVMIEFGF